MGRRALLFLLRDNVDKKRHIIAETLGNILDCIRCVLDHIVQKCRDNRIRTQTEFLGNNLGDSHRMHDIRLARLASLLHMGLACKKVSIVDSCYVIR